MLFKTVTVLALATSALARAHHKRQHDHFHQHSGSAGFGYPTGGIWGSNHTGPFGTDAGASGLAGSSAASTPAPMVSTLTVQPLPVSSAPAVASSPSMAAVGNSNVVAAVESGTAEAGAATSSCDGTTTTTSTSWYTVTVTPTAPGSEASAVAPAGTISADSSAASFSAASSAPSLSLVPDSTSLSSAAGGGFFQRPSSVSFGGIASSSAAVSVPTTLVTSLAASTVASVWSSASVASSAPTASSTSTGGGSGGGKRGLSFNTASLTDAFAGNGITWVYNWAAAPGGTFLSGAEYVPMLWGMESVSGWSSAAQSAISSGSTHLLSFNEPDLPAQSNIDPATAATAHIANMNPLKSGSVSIGSPAVTNGAGTSPPQGINWLNQFFSDCGGKCTVDFVAFHWYGDSISDLESHVSAIASAASTNGVSELWLTEFGYTGTDATTFLSQALTFLDSSAVTRYAYFMCGSGANELLSGTSLSSLGSLYAA